jgi:hypothetical protein
MALLLVPSGVYEVSMQYPIHTSSVVTDRGYICVTLRYTNGNPLCVMEEQVNVACDVTGVGNEEN